MQEKKNEKESVKVKAKKILADVGGVLWGFIEQTSNGMDMMATNTCGDGISLGERIKMKRAELRRRIAERENKKKAEAIKKAVSNKRGR